MSPASRPWAGACGRMWRLRDPDRAPRSASSRPVRALVQRLGPHVDDVEPDRRRPRATRSTATSWSSGWSPSGYRREDQVEHRGEVAVRGSIVDVFPSTADAPGAHRPVGRRGRPAHRVLGGRPALDRRPRPRSRSSRAGSCCPPTRCGTGPSALVAPRAVGPRAVGAAGRGPDLRRHGVVAAVAHRRTSALLFDLLGADAQVLLVEPAPHARPGRRPPGRGGRPGRHARRDLGCRPAATAHGFPQLHLPFDRLLAHTDAPAWTVTTAPEGPDVATWRRRLGRRSSATATVLVRQLAEPPRRRLPGRASPPTGPAPRPPGGLLAERRPRLAGHDGDAPPTAAATWSSRRSSGAASSPRSSWPCWPRPTSPAAAGPTAGPRPRRRDTEGFFDDLKPGDYVVHHQHGVARYGGMVKRAIGGVERDYLLLEYRGDDRLYVPSDQIDAVRHYTGGDSPVAQPPRRRRLAEDQGPGPLGRGRDRPGAGRALPDAGPHARPRLRRRHAVAARAGGGLPLRGDARPAPRPSTTSRPTWRPPHPMDRLVCGDVGFGKTEVAHPGRVQGGAGRQAGGRARAHHAAGPAALPDLQRPLRRLPGAGRGAAAASSPPPRPEGGRRASRSGEVDVVIGTHRLLSDDVRFKDLGLLVVDEEQRFGVTPQGADQAARAPTSTCSRSRPRRSPARSR